MDISSYAIKKLGELTNKKIVKLTSRGNKSIEYALKIAKKLGKKKLFIQDQGGWITYTQLAKKLKFELVILDTDFGVVNPDILSVKIDNDSILLINSLSGYFAEQPMEKIAEICKKKECLLLNDVSGSIGTELAKFGDIIFGSFSEEKPIWVGKGGFIAFDNLSFESLIEMTNPEFDFELLKNEIDGLSAKLEKLYLICKKIKKDLSAYEILHSKDQGLVVVIKFNSIEQKNELIEYCNRNKYEYEICPRNIRVMCDAVSIEVKRIKS